MELSLVIDITHDFERRFAEEKPLVVKYYADWCMDCRLLDDVYDSVSSQFSKKDIVIAEMDCTFNNETEKFCIERGIKVFPTVKFYNTGIDISTYKHELTSEYDLKRWVQEHLTTGRDDL